jgi:hypothetical protein
VPGFVCSALNHVEEFRPCPAAIKVHLVLITRNDHKILWIA